VYDEFTGNANCPAVTVAVLPKLHFAVSWVAKSSVKASTFKAPVPLIAAVAVSGEAVFDRPTTPAPVIVAVVVVMLLEPLTATTPLPVIVAVAVSAVPPLLAATPPAAANARLR
jgi:hypothetical protein